MKLYELPDDLWEIPPTAQPYTREDVERLVEVSKAVEVGWQQFIDDVIDYAEFTEQYLTPQVEALKPFQEAK